MIRYSGPSFGPITSALLNQANLEHVLAKLSEERDAVIALRPTRLLIQPRYYKQALKILYYRPAIGRSAPAARKRKRALMWRKRK